MNYYDWRDRNKTELARFTRHARSELGRRIPDFPKFRVRATSQMTRPRRFCNGNEYAAAHIGALFDHAELYWRRKPVWLVEFNDHCDALCDIETTLYHELAHFMACVIELRCPSHGLLWAACCDALTLVMEMDSDSRDEGTEWLLVVDKAERRDTFRAERIRDEAEWRHIRACTRAVLDEHLAGYGTRISYADLMGLVGHAVRVGRVRAGRPLSR